MDRRQSGFGGGREMGGILQRFDYLQKKCWGRFIGGAVFLIICGLLCLRIQSNIQAYNRSLGAAFRIAYANADRVYLFLLLLGVVEFLEATVWTLAYRQMYVEVGEFGIRGKAWNKQVWFIPTMPQFFQLSYGDIVRVELGKVLKVYTKQGSEYYVYVENAARAKALMEQQAAALDPADYL